MGIYIEVMCGETVDKQHLKLIKKAAAAVLKRTSFTKSCDINITVTDNKDIREINKQHRQVDSETDVLSFPFFTPDELEGDMPPGDCILGDIVISLEKAEAQANEYGHSLSRELGFLTVHGVLHLIGYDHETPGDEKNMTSMQEEILNKMRLFR